MPYLADLWALPSGYKKNNYLDVGLGTTWMETDFDSPDSPKGVWVLNSSLGFRRNFGDSGMWRLHLTPYNTSISKSRVLFEGAITVIEEFDWPTIWFGFSIGRRF